MGKVKKVDESTHAVLAIDPGGTTGVAAAYVDLGYTLKETLVNARKKKTREVKGDWKEQAEVLHDLCTKFVYTANVENQIPFSNIHFVFEDFQSRPGGIVPQLTSIWVMAPVFHTLWQLNYDVVLQQPSDAKGFSTNERLRMWELWIVGSEHERDANRHLAKRVNDLVA